MTPTATNLIEELRSRADFYAERAEVAFRADGPQSRAETNLFRGYRDGLRLAVSIVEKELPGIETAAFLVPERCCDKSPFHAGPHWNFDVS